MLFLIHLTVGRAKALLPSTLSSETCQPAIRRRGTCLRHFHQCNEGRKAEVSPALCMLPSETTYIIPNGRQRSLVHSPHHKWRKIDAFMLPSETTWNVPHVHERSIDAFKTSQMLAFGRPWCSGQKLVESPTCASVCVRSIYRRSRMCGTQLVSDRSLRPSQISEWTGMGLLKYCLVPRLLSGLAFAIRLPRETFVATWHMSLSGNNSQVLVQKFCPEDNSWSREWTELRS